MERGLGDFRAKNGQGQDRGRLKAGHSDPCLDDPKGPPQPARWRFRGGQAPATGSPCAASVPGPSGDLVLCPWPTEGQQDCLLAVLVNMCCEWMCLFCKHQKPCLLGTQLPRNSHSLGGKTWPKEMHKQVLRGFLVALSLPG